jgi:hypothetical protein
MDQQVADGDELPGMAARAMGGPKRGMRRMYARKTGE